ncbi:hypothetical protein ACI6Q2_10265 [Chitinophagaceae bacterium LWZ2-11]
MANSGLSKLLMPLIAVFLFINGICLYFIQFSQKYGLGNIDFGVILWGNVILGLLSIITIAIHYKTVKKGNPQVFIRGVMAGTFLKLMVVMITILVYVNMAGKNKNRTAVLICMGLYVIYTILEVLATSRLNKRKNGNS